MPKEEKVEEEISEEELENMEKMFSEIMPVAQDGDDDEDSPTIDFGKLMKSVGFGADKKAERATRTIKRRIRRMDVST